MGFGDYAYRFLVSNLLTLYYNFMVLLMFAINYVKNPFGDPWAMKLRLEPPACLTDPKYGVHKYIKVNVLEEQSSHQTARYSHYRGTKKIVEWKWKLIFSMNITLHYVESGDPAKPLMIFVHGFPEFWYSWRHQIVEFNKDYWCIAFDLRGYADSEKPDDVSSYRLDILVEDIRDLVRQLGREKCIIVSHDWGGLISCRFRDRYPEVCSGLVMLASASIEAFFHELWANPEQKKMSWYVFMFRARAIPERLMQMNNLQSLDAMLVPGKDSVTTQDVECYKYWFGKQYTLTPPVNFYRANFYFDMPEKNRSDDDVPLLVALAANDRYLSRNLLDTMKREYKCIETTVVDGCEHFLQQEEPAKVNALIRDFLAKHSL